jgi:hypothetical protein
MEICFNENNKRLSLSILWPHSIFQVSALPYPTGKNGGGPGQSPAKKGDRRALYEASFPIKNFILIHWM